MIEQAERILANLSQFITEQDVKIAQQRIILQEQERLKQPEIWLNHLVLSYQHYADGRYIEQIPNMVKQITSKKYITHKV